MSLHVKVRKNETPIFFTSYQTALVENFSLKKLIYFNWSHRLEGKQEIRTNYVSLMMWWRITLNIFQLCKFDYRKTCSQNRMIPYQYHLELFLEMFLKVDFQLFKLDFFTVFPSVCRFVQIAFSLSALESSWHVHMMQHCCPSISCHYAITCGNSHESLSPCLNLISL